MQNFRTKNNRVLALKIFLIGCLMSCKSNSTESTSSIDLVGQWEATEIQGAIDANGNPLNVDGNVSTWTFNSNGTYRWFLHALPWYDLNGTGTYNLNGATLTVDGIIANTLYSRTTGKDDAIKLTIGTNTLSFRDEDGDRWSYKKVK
jgi:hypothetical protein